MSIVVTEGLLHQRLLDLLLSDVAERYPVQVIAGGSADAARPLARRESLLGQQPVVLAIDAGSVDAGHVGAQQRDLEFYFSWGANGLPLKVVQFVPGIEVIFFQRPQVLERLLGRKLDPALMIAGEVAPRALLERLGHGNLEDRLGELTPADLYQLRGHPAIAAIREFVVANAEPALARRSA
jgi:hypothetical protein